MSGVVLKLAAPPPFDLDARDLVPDTLLDMDLDGIRSLKVQQGRKRSRLDELFEISACTDDVVRIENATPRLHHIAHGMRGGRLQVSGTIGDGVGTDMSGGVVAIDGDTGAFVGSGMRGGLIDISGNAGDFVAGALPDEPLGQRGGVIRIGGDVGARAGDRMRRGLLIVNGNAGRYCGSNMIAGTIIVTGECADGVGIGMRRGTILMTRRPAEVPVTFNPCGTYALAMLELLRRYVGEFDQRAARRLGRIRQVERFAGDRGADGQGELLIATA